MRPNQRWVVKVADFDSVKRDERFCAIVALARAVNALHFVHAPLTGNEKGDTPEARRNRCNSILFACSLFAEASLLIARMRKYFRTHPGFQLLAAVANSKEARSLLKGNLFKLRNKLVFHFDVAEVQEQLATLKLANPILLTAMGEKKRHAYLELADLVALNVLFGTKAPTDAEIGPAVRTMAEVIPGFLNAAEKFIVDVLIENGWAETVMID